MALCFWFLDASIINFFKAHWCKGGDLSQSKFRTKLIWAFIEDTLDGTEELEFVNHKKGLELETIVVIKGYTLSPLRLNDQRHIRASVK
jgi:hypothetical protein